MGFANTVKFSNDSLEAVYSSHELPNCFRNVRAEQYVEIHLSMK